MNLLYETWVLIFIYFFIFFIVATVIKNNSIVDIGWGIGFVLVAWYAYFKGERSTSAMMVTWLVTIWGLRLFYHIIKRNWGQPEDFRYANWREAWGKWVVPRAFLQVFMLQGFFMALISSAFVLLNNESVEDMNVLIIIGLMVWFVGFYFEAVGDYQLKTFKKNPENRGKIITIGLWKFSRHPNYFGEFTMWWGIFLVAYGCGVNALSIISPLAITGVLVFISGPMLEKKYEGRDDFEAYKYKTSMFLPWLEKHILDDV